MQVLSHTESELSVKILEWPTPAEWSSFPPGLTLGDKVRWRTELAQKLKAPLLALLRNIPEVTISNELNATTQAIVVAPLCRWQKILRDNGPDMLAAGVTLHDNDIVTSPHATMRSVSIKDTHFTGR